jgi:succinate dehydrogenase / fumarate reductase cytochrome b subunit
MGTVATSTKLHRTLKFYEAAAGKKTVMAVTGAALWLFVIGHLLGNLQVFFGPTKLDEYGEALRSVPAILWTARIGLVAMFGLHIVAAVQLWSLKNRARPVGYAKKVPTTSTWASRVMYWSGPVLLAFLVYHLLDLTLGVVNPGFRDGAVNDNLVRSFSQPLVAGFYILAMAMLWAHLTHGIWSLFQTLGFGHPRYAPRLRFIAGSMALLLAGGNIAIVASVLLGILKTQ